MIEHSYGTRFQDFQSLMRFHIRDVLLVSSLYDSFLIEEDGRLFEQIRNEYQELSLSHSPEMTRISSGKEALTLLQEKRHFDLIITTMHIEDMQPLQFAEQARSLDNTIPIVLLAFDNQELSELIARKDTSIFDRIFMWHGDYRLIIAIIKHIEDKINIRHDTATVGVQSIILIEDNIWFYSSYLPLIYTEIHKQSQRLISEGLNLSHRFLRMRARPKIILCTTYEEAWNYFEQYREYILGIISDVDFHRDGEADSEAGLEFARNVKDLQFDIPILLQSNQAENEQKAYDIGASFILKDSPRLLDFVREYMHQYFSFGDFIFRNPDGEEVGTATNLRTLEEQLRRIPDESLRFHAERNHFSNWLKARTEFSLAHKLRPKKVTDYESTEGLRAHLIASLQEYRQRQQEGLISDFEKETFDSSRTLARIGGGSLGGKARGLGFMKSLLSVYNLANKFPGIQIGVPSGVIIGTEVFDYFMETNHLNDLAFSNAGDEEIIAGFVGAKKFPRKIYNDLSSFLEMTNVPLAIRSSSLQEDSQYRPFAGVYETYMIPNNHRNPAMRLRELLTAIKRVYASTFCKTAREYTRHSSFRLEEEKMAVIIQALVGAQHDERFYPDFSGVAKSYNFYPIPPQQPSDGIVSVALGLGKIVVDGGRVVRFCPKYPTQMLQLLSIEETLSHNQHEFFALALNEKSIDPLSTGDDMTKKFSLSFAEKDDTLRFVASTYSHENEAMYDGLSRSGLRLVTFAPILKNKLFPLPEVLQTLLDLGTRGMGVPVEIEFAVNMSVDPVQIGLLQMRPLTVSHDIEELALETIDPETILCRSEQILGSGTIENIFDIVFVDINHFDRSKTAEVALEVGHINATLVAAKKPYLLIGLGRWGTLDPWLGIPVRWDQISGARAIVETGFADFIVEPSQGSHFFQNLTAFRVGYFTVNQQSNKGFIDWDWLLRQPVVEEKFYTRHVRLKKPVIIKMSGQTHKGVIIKPER